jgi:uncharacterized membrane protein YccC
MTEAVSSELVYFALQDLRDEMADMERDLRTHRAEMSAVISALARRIDAVETRLDLLETVAVEVSRSLEALELKCDRLLAVTAVSLPDPALRTLQASQRPSDQSGRPW